MLMLFQIASQDNPGCAIGVLSKRNRGKAQIDRSRTRQLH
jgi:hypothetical protein